MGWGTANVIVPLGDEYVELVGIVDEDQARGTAFGDWMRMGTAESDRLLGWAISVQDVAAGSLLAFLATKCPSQVS